MNEELVMDEWVMREERTHDHWRKDLGIVMDEWRVSYGWMNYNDGWMVDEWEMFGWILTDEGYSMNDYWIFRALRRLESHRWLGVEGHRPETPMKPIQRLIHSANLTCKIKSVDLQLQTLKIYQIRNVFPHWVFLLF